MHFSGAKNSHQKNAPNQNAFQYGQNVGFRFPTSRPPNNEHYINSNQTGTVATGAAFQNFPGNTPRNVIPFPMYPNNSIQTSVSSTNSVRFPYANSMFPNVPVSTRIPPPMVQNVPLHLPPPVAKIGNSSVPLTNHLYNQTHNISSIHQSEVQVKDVNSQGKIFQNENIYNHGQSVGFQHNASVSSNNQGCINQSQTQSMCMPGSTNRSNTLSSPFRPNSSVSFSTNSNVPVCLPYNNNLQSVFSVAAQQPPPHLQNINFSVPPPVPKAPACNYMPSNLSSKCDKETKLMDFLNRFTRERKSEDNSIKIPEYRTTLKAAFSKLKELTHHRSTLQNMLYADEDAWKSEVQKVSTLQKELSEVCQLVSVPNLLNSVLKKLKVIEKKREQKKKTKRNILAAKRMKELKRRELHEEVDKWLDDIKEKNLKMKREAEMKKEADFILLEVRRKIYEAKRTIEKIKVFEKLRQARQANSVKKGLHVVPEHDEAFEKNVSILRQTMIRQLADYEAEETALKVMLETEQEGQLSFMHQLRKTLQEKKHTHITECLFGNSGDPRPTNPLYFFFQYHTAASSSIENLLQIRHQWDMFLANDGEAVPLQWVVPTSTNNSWDKWLVKVKD